MQCPLQSDPFVSKHSLKQWTSQAIHSNTVQHTTTQCDTMQHIAIQYDAMHYKAYIKHTTERDAPSTSASPSLVGTNCPEAFLSAYSLCWMVLMWPAIVASVPIPLRSISPIKSASDIATGAVV
jgi:hypothetical protein